MLVRAVQGLRHCDLDVQVHDPRATVADLAAVLAPHRPRGALTIDGVSAPPEQGLDRTTFGAGSVVDVGHLPQGQPVSIDRTEGAGTAGITLTVVSGFDAGREVAVPPGRWLLGRPGPSGGATRLALIPVDDPAVAPAHADLVVDAGGGALVTDLGSGRSTQMVASDGSESLPPSLAPSPATGHDPSHHGRFLPGVRRLRLRWRRLSSSWWRWCRGGRACPAAASGPEPLVLTAGAVLALGSAHVVIGPPLAPPAIEPPALGSTTRPVHRRPRPPFAAEPEPLTPPDTPAAPPAVTPVGIAAVVVSVLAGGVMVVVLHSWAYAAFALLGPVLLVANGLDSRRRRRQAARRGDRRRRRDLERFERELVDAAEAARDRLAALHPGPVGALDRPVGPAPLCWDRRTGHPDAYAVRLGSGTVGWAPPLAGSGDEPAADVAAVLEQHRTLERAAVGCRLDPASPLAIVGPRRAALALARSILVQAAVDHGPADLRIAVISDGPRSSAWRWCSWLPHSRAADGERLLADRPESGEAVAALLLGERTSSGVRRRTIVVLDDPAGLAARRSASRSVLRAAAEPANELVPIVLVTDPHDVPAVCATVLTVSTDGRLTGPPWIFHGEVDLVGVGAATADEVARRLARLDDPELEDTGRNLPASVALAALVELDPTDPAAIAQHWRAAGPDPAPVATVGSAADGPLVVDLAADGPHALVAGTTGAGKSELLRTLVASLALSVSPDHLTFVLIDFKGGSAFDACARLPHTTGVVTDLDDHLAARALRCLEAELRHRERRLRGAGVADLTAWRRRHTTGGGAGGGEAHGRGDDDGEGGGEKDGDDGPFPRLVVVVDEFATLGAELPEFVDALLGIAQRGRSLGVHLVLATQRPSGAVSENIRANTNLRIALRVQDVADSRDVIDRPDAADLPRRHPGRALARLGPDEVIAFQTALVSGRSRGKARYVTARPAQFADPPDRPARLQPDANADPSSLSAECSNLDRLVAATTRAWADVGGRPPRRPWPDPLPSTLTLRDPRLATDAPAAGADALVVGLADDPDHQRHQPFAWLLDDGPLIAIGLAGSGTTTLAATTVLTAARRWSPEDLHVHVIDLGGGGLRALADLPHVGAVIEGDDDERQRRLLGAAAADLAQRRRAGQATSAAADLIGGEPRRLLVIHGLAALRSRWDDLEATGTWAHLVDLVTHGTSVGIHVLATVEGGRSVPHQVLAACRQRLVFRLAERGEHAAFGIAPADVPSLPPGRAVAAEGSRLVQVARAEPDLATAAAEVAEGWPTDSCAGTTNRSDRTDRTDESDESDESDRSDRTDGSKRPARRAAGVDVLPEHVKLDQLTSPWASREPDGALRLVIGVADHDLAAAHLELPPGGHALVAGAHRSGRTTALRTIAAAVHASGMAVVAVSGRPHEWSSSPWPVLSADDSELAAAIEDRSGGALLVVVDDADLTSEVHPVLNGLAGSRITDRHVVAAARPDRVRNRYGHWLREVLVDRSGVLLRPDPNLDGELLGLRLPRRAAEPAPVGRGWMATARGAELVQIAAHNACTG